MTFSVFDQKKPKTFDITDTLLPADFNLFIFTGNALGSAALANPPVGIDQVWITNQSPLAEDVNITSAALVNGQAAVLLAAGEHLHLFWTGSTWYAI